MIDKETYKERFAIPDASGIPSIEQINWKAERKKQDRRKGIIKAVCLAAALLILSNGICLAATGVTWAGMIWDTVLENGVRVIYRIDENGFGYSAAYSDGNATGYTVYENGRTYFVFRNSKTDITDIVAGGENYYRYEYTDKIGLRHIIYVGEMVLDEVEVGAPKVFVSLWLEKIVYPNGQVGTSAVLPEFDKWPEWAKKAEEDFSWKD